MGEEPGPQRSRATCHGHTAIRSQGLRFKVQSVCHFTLTRFVGILSEIFYVHASRYFVCEERGKIIFKD